MQCWHPFQMAVVMLLRFPGKLQQELCIWPAQTIANSHQAKEAGADPCLNSLHSGPRATHLLQQQQRPAQKARPLMAAIAQLSAMMSQDIVVAMQNCWLILCWKDIQPQVLWQTTC